MSRKGANSSADTGAARVLAGAAAFVFALCACLVLCLRRFRAFLKSGGQHIEEGRPQRTKSVKRAITDVEARYLEEAGNSAGTWTDDYFNFDRNWEEHRIGEIDPQNAKTYHPKKDFARTRGPRRQKVFTGAWAQSIGVAGCVAEGICRFQGAFFFV